MSPEKKSKNLFTLYFEDKLCASIYIVTGFPNSIFMPFPVADLEGACGAPLPPPKIRKAYVICYATLIKQFDK